MAEPILLLGGDNHLLEDGIVVKISVQRWGGLRRLTQLSLSQGIRWVGTGLPTAITTLSYMLTWMVMIH